MWRLGKKIVATTTYADERYRTEYSFADNLLLSLRGILVYENSQKKKKKKKKKKLNK